MKESKAIAQGKRKVENQLEQKIKELEEKVAKENNEKDWEDLDTQKTKLEKIYNEKAQGLIIQSRVQIYEEGEKSTAFFLNQIKQNKRKSTIRKLMDEETELIDQKSIMTKLNNFYSQLYTKDRQCKVGNWINKLKSDGLVPQLSEDEKLELDALLEIEELQLTLEKCANNKSPGNDGLTKEFYLFFWDEIKDALFQSYTESIKIGKLSTSQRQNIISLLEKTGKDKTLIKKLETNITYKFRHQIAIKNICRKIKKCNADTCSSKSGSIC